MSPQIKSATPRLASTPGCIASDSHIENERSPLSNMEHQNRVNNDGECVKRSSRRDEPLVGVSTWQYR
jgi:hypothetical protein